MSEKLYAAFAFLGFVLVLIPLPWHLHAWNAGTCLFMVWTALGCLIHFVNSIVWAGNTELHSALWCDISSKLIVGLSVALPCATLCINRRLYAIATLSQVHITKAEKRRTVYIDLAIGIGFPIIVMALHYIVQGHRFDIFEDIGCWPSTFNTPPAYPLVWMWPIVIGLISMTYCALSLNAFLRRRKEFNEFLATNKTMNISRYFRLMGLAVVEICTTTPLSIYFMYLNLSTVEISPWISWSDTKWHFSRIDYVQAFFVNSQPLLKLNFTLNLWLFPICAFVFFGFFGSAEEAQRNYKRLYYLTVSTLEFKPKVEGERFFNVKPPGITIKLPSTQTDGDKPAKHASKSHWDDRFLKMSDMADSESDMTSLSQISPHVSLPFPIPTVECPRTPTSAIPSPPTNQHTLFERRFSTSTDTPPFFCGLTGTDNGIIISPAYHPDAENTSQHHEETFIARTTSKVKHMPESRPQDGIWMTVERTVV